MRVDKIRPFLAKMPTSIGERGAAIIEFALVVMLLFIITVGITELGRALWYHNAMQKAARDGARCISHAIDNEGICIDRVVEDSRAANVLIDEGNVSVSYDPAGGGAEYVTLTLTYSMPLIWSGGGGGPLPPPPPQGGGGSGKPSIKIEAIATMPYLPDLW